MNADESRDEGYYYVKSTLDVLVPGILGSVIEPAGDHLGEEANKAQGKTCNHVAALENSLVGGDGAYAKADYCRYSEKYE